jgi:amidase
MSELLGLIEHAELLAEGTASSSELVGAALERVAESPLGAFRVVRDEAALAEAAAADRRLAAGERLPLLGVPVAIKDDMDLAGETTMFGCAGEFVAKTADGEVARRLRAAGAVIVGKTNTPELGLWPYTEGPAFGVTRNPWNLDYSPGGSSGGSAAAVAAGLVPAAVGSDGAGSVRIPAAWCHLVGLKPQRGRVSTWPDPDAFNGLACNGPLARTVGDAAYLLDVLTGNHPGDRHQPPAPAEPFAVAAAREPGPLRIALSLRIPFSGPPARLDPEIEAAVRRLAGVLEGLGHEIVDADPDYGLVGLSFVPRGTHGAANWLLPEGAQIDHRTRENIRTGRVLGGPVLKLARAAERPLQHQLGRVFKKADVVLAPTTARPATKIGAYEGLSGWGTDKLMISHCPYAWPWNVVGWPALNVPAGFTAGGLPIGAQLIGPACAEARLLALAASLEAAERWQDHAPMGALSRR